ncbi:MAG: peptidoglycan-associated lipoprotein, partial [Gammaproteobacteria bacterium RIFOXYB2_FULL_38_6]
NNAIQNQAYYFDRDQINVKSSDMSSLIKQADYLVKHPNVSVIIIGNTDERGSHEYNLALGWKRAQSVANVLMQQGVLPKQIDMISYGEEMPANLWHNEKAWAANRRVDLIYTDNKE